MADSGSPRKREEEEEDDIVCLDPSFFVDRRATASEELAPSKINPQALDLQQSLHHFFEGAKISTELFMELDDDNGIDFLWLQPEEKKFGTAFNNLRKLSLHGIFVEFNLLWTLVFLDAAPFLEMFDIEIWEHPCQINDLKEIFGEKTNPSWKVPKFAVPKNSSYMKELQIIGFKPLEQQIEFIRSVMQRAPMLDTILLKYDDPCEDCEKMGIFPPRPFMKCVLPKDMDEQDMVVSLLKDGVSSTARIIFDT